MARVRSVAYRGAGTGERARGPARLVLGGAALTALILLLAAAPAYASLPPTADPQVRVTVPDQAEAWYASTPVLCGSPVGCPPTSAQSTAYPAHTLHVGVAGGQETDRTYVQPAFADLPAGSTPLAATLTLPLSTVSGAGTTNASSADVAVCLVTTPIPSGVEGSPPTNAPHDTCAVHATAVLHGGTTFTVDLAPFLTAWAGGTPEEGVVLLPAANQAPTADWQLAFNDRTAAGVAHISTTVTVALAPAATSTNTGSGTPATTAAAAPPVTPALPAVPAPLGPGPVLGVAPATVPSAVPAPAVAAAPNPAPATVEATTASAGTGFRYPEVFLLPLLLLAGVAYLGRILTADVTPARSKL